MSEQGWYWIAAAVLTLGISSEVANSANTFRDLACNVLARIEHVPGRVGQTVALAEASMSGGEVRIRDGQLAVIQVQSRLAQAQARMDRKQAVRIRRQAERAAFVARRQAERASVWSTECAEKELRQIPTDEADLF
jgi:hypothetical protein